MISKKLIRNKSLNEQLALYLGDKEYKENKNNSEEDNFSLLCNNNGVIPVKMKLPKYWIKRPVGYIIMNKKNSKQKYLLVTGGFAGYKYYDPNKDKFIAVNPIVAKEFDTDNATMVFTGLPNRPLKSKDILRFAFTSWKPINYILIVFAALAVTAFGYWLPKLNNLLFANANPDGIIWKAFGIVLGIVAFNVGKILFSAIQKSFVATLSTRTDLRLRMAMMQRIVTLPNRTFTDIPAGEITKRIEYLENVANSSVSAIFVYGLTTLFSVSYFYQISKYGSMLIIPSLVVVSITALFSIYEIILQTKVSRKVIEAELKSNNSAISNITGIQKLKIAGAEERAYKKWNNDFERELEVKYNPPFMVKAQMPILSLLNGLSSLALFGMTIRNKMDVATYYAFQTAFGLIMSSFQSLNELAKAIAELNPVFELLQPLISIAPENKRDAKEVRDLEGNISINNVSFKYNDNSPCILKNFSLKINKGEYIGIVGKTGCGKSTLVKLILGFEKPFEGSVCYDGIDIENVNKTSLRKHIGTVMQNDKLFVGSIFENLTICAPNLNEEQAWEIADLVDMKNDIMSMPMKMKTLISEGGGGVSGGQRQRLVIGRAIANRPKVIILDEATSALDNIAQNKICRSLDKFNCTRIVIAHRLSTIKNCDRIIVLKDGSIVEDGKYAELIKQKGYFASLVEKQRLD